MVETLVERAWTWVHATFPERQIYIRSDGRVQFFTFGPTLQATMAGLALVFLTWVAFASVNVIFKDHIILAKDHRFQAMQANYENRIADLQLSYDELNGALVSAEDKFKSVADQLQLKQQAVAGLLGRRMLVDSAVGGGGVAIPRSPTAGTASDSLGALPPGGLAPFGGSDGSSELSVMPQPVAPAPRTASPTRASFLDGTIERLTGAAGALFHRSAARPVSTAALRNPALRALAEQTARVQGMNGAETALLQGVDARVSTRVASVEGVMRQVGLNPNAFAGGTGGPLIPMSDVRIQGIDDPAFTAVYVQASAHGKELAELFGVLNHVPLTTPVHGAGFELTSDFGPRVDPFTHHVAFHPGLDFGGPWGATVNATAPGTVTYAGPRGGYGNMVEVDHGYGMRTRYGHLSSILVRVGAKVAKGAPVGRLGSTGRSTGPHVHYEVWLADAVRDPSRFIEAGRHVQ